MSASGATRPKISRVGLYTLSRTTRGAALAAWLMLAAFAGAAGAELLEDADAAYGRGDYAAALRLMRPLADQGNTTAQSNLGFMYFYGQGVPQDYAEAVMWYRKAAGKGNAYAQVLLGYMYEEGGKGVPRDYAQAVMWYHNAADQGNANGQSNLGSMYYNGQGVPQDYAEAVKWWRKAADQGDAKGQSNLGFMYYNGQGVPQDYVQAHRWFNLVASHSPSSEEALSARDMLAKLMTLMTPVQIAEAQRLVRVTQQADGNPATTSDGGQNEPALPRYKVGSASGLLPRKLTPEPPADLAVPPPVPAPPSTDAMVGLKASVQICIKSVRDQAKRPENFFYGVEPMWKNFDAFVTPDARVINNGQLVGEMEGVYRFKKCLADYGLFLR